VTALPAAQIEAIVFRREPAPQSHRDLSTERQIDFCLRQIAQEVSLCDPHAVVRTEQAARDSNGAIVFNADGSPKVVAQTVLKRDVAGAHWKAQLAQVQASYRRRLQKSNADHARDAEELQRAIAGEFGTDRTGLTHEISDFAAEFQRKHGHFIG
jgi:hypothetical protein